MLHERLGDEIQQPLHSDAQTRFREMTRGPTSIGPKLQALLDERDHVRVKISLGMSVPQGDQLAELRRQLFELDRKILKNWEDPSA